MRPPAVIESRYVKQGFLCLSYRLAGIIGNTVQWYPVFRICIEANLISRQQCPDCECSDIESCLEIELSGNRVSRYRIRSNTCFKIQTKSVRINEQSGFQASGYRIMTFLALKSGYPETGVPL